MKKFLQILLIVLFIVLVFVFSWLATTGVIKLITLCFGWNFSLRIATGIWLLLILVSGFFKQVVSK